MEHLPPVGWADVTTKQDLAQLEARMEVRFASLEERMESRFETIEYKLLATMREEFVKHTQATVRTMLLGNAATFAAVAGIAFAAARLT